MVRAREASLFVSIHENYIGREIFCFYMHLTKVLILVLLLMHGFSLSLVVEVTTIGPAPAESL